jgi:hypothetical protein
MFAGPIFVIGFVAIGVCYLVNLNYNIKRCAWLELLDPALQ